jgi:ABC-type multidrug transport system ATPase subunit
MKQRLLIARALLAHPALLLLDEPTRSLDPISARSFRSFLRTELAAREGCTIVLATHSGEEAMELCDRVAIMDRGRLLALGTAGEIGREVGGERFALWTTEPEHPAIRSLMSQGVATEMAMQDAGADGWSCVHLVIPGGPPVTARVVDVLTCAGVPVARFERAPLSLADLIDRVVKRAAREER